MLILRRRIGESIVIDGRIEVSVLHVRGGKVRLGFSAPREVRILRQEMTGEPPERSAETAEVPAETADSLG
jgi:carbon storage regulator